MGRAGSLPQLLVDRQHGLRNETSQIRVVVPRYSVPSGSMFTMNAVRVGSEVTDMDGWKEQHTGKNVETKKVFCNKLITYNAELKLKTMFFNLPLSVVTTFIQNTNSELVFLSNDYC